MIGYNVAEAQKLIDSIVATYNQMSSKIGQEWPAFTQTMQTEWVGPDQVNMQNIIAKRLIELHENCRVTVQQTANNLVELEKNWRRFQQDNKIDGSVDVSSIRELDAPGNLSSNIRESVNDNFSKTFTEGQNLGLTNGVSSAQNIQNKATEFANAVSSYVKQIYNEIESSKAFFGEQQEAGIKSYLDKIGEGLGKYLTCFKDLNDALTNLAGQSYSQSAQDVGTQYSSANADINLNNNNLS